ncbi:MAG TPA: CmcI family methyltransferase [Terriglobales bacterium]
MDPRSQQITDDFLTLYYPNFTKTRWMGVYAAKCPFDLFVYQELIFELRPDLIIECGTFDGGSALFLAHMCDITGKGGIITVDVEARPHPRHKRITYLQGDTLAPKTIESVSKAARKKKSIMVILDDDHSAAHVLDELRTYSTFVTPGSYLIVEDTIVNGNPILPDFGPGPMEAVQAFLKESDAFVIDESREKYLLSFNRQGFLKKRY